MSNISKERKAIYYIGFGMMILGFILFISVFFVIASTFKQPFGYKSPPPFINSILGMILLITGSFVMNIGAKGTAGAGLILDPKKAREDLKLFNEAKGEMISDVIGSIDGIDRISKTLREKEVIKIRCLHCRCVNDEDAKFCKDCGKTI